MAACIGSDWLTRRVLVVFWMWLHWLIKNAVNLAEQRSTEGVLDVFTIDLMHDVIIICKVKAIVKKWSDVRFNVHFSFKSEFSYSLG